MGCIMKNLHFMTFAVLAMLVLSGCGTLEKKELSPEAKAQQAKLSAVLPFEICIAGDKAQLNNEFCAKIVNPVDAVSEVVIGAKSNDVIVASIYESDAEGIAKKVKNPSILLIDNGGKGSLDKTQNGEKLKPGFYVMQVNADNKIASVVFEIKK